MAQKEKSIDWLYDYTLQFLKSPGWRIPIVSFMDENCHAFDSEEENKLIYTEIHNKFKELIDNLLENLCREIGVTPQQFVKVCGIGMKSPAHHRIFEQIVACDNYLSFKKLMLKRNKEIEKEAAKTIANTANSEPKSKMQTKEQEEIALAISLSLSKASGGQKGITKPEVNESQEALRQNEEDRKEREAQQLTIEKLEVQLVTKEKLETKAKQIEEEKKSGIHQAHEDNLHFEEVKELAKDQEDNIQRDKKLLEKRNKREKALEQNHMKNQQEELAKATAFSQHSAKRHGEGKSINTENTEDKSHHELRPIQKRKQGPADAMDFLNTISKEKNENAEAADKISSTTEDSHEAPGSETLVERQARLKKQRDLLLAHKKQERELELKEFVDNGGSDFSIKKELSHLPPLITAEEAEKRRNIISKIRNNEDAQ